MKPRFAALLMLLCLLVCAPRVRAADTTLYTSVPTEHCLALDIGPGGAANGVRGRGQITVKRQDTLSISITPDAGYRLKTLLYNGEDVTAQVQNGVFTVEALSADGMLTARFFHYNSSIPSTGDNTPLLLYAMLFAGSLAGLCFLLLAEKKRRRP